MIEYYYTISKLYGPCEIKEKGSRFISFLYPVLSMEDGENKLKKIRKEYYDATHVCFAYRLGEGREEYFRLNDDGEPSGTAGQPIYQEIVRKELYNVLVPVIRYFGGIKLGKGGLQRAYSGSARNIIEQSLIETVEIKKEIIINIPFNFIGEMMHIISRLDIKIINQNYNPDGISMNLSVPIGRVEDFKKILIEKSNGKIIL